MRRFASVLLLAAAIGWAQGTLTIDQLESFVRSSIQLKHQDRDVAAYLRTVRLQNQLEERLIAELEAAGAGPRTLEALRALREVSLSLPVLPAQTPKPLAEIPPPSAAEWRKIIEETRQYAASYTKQLPDFICTQVTRRAVDRTGLGDWQSQDVLTTRLSYFDQKEEYKLVSINGRPSELAYEKVGGATSTGEFGSLLKEIFDKQTRATFQWERWATLRGRRTHVFSYRVEKAYSQWMMVYQETDRYVPGYHGLIYVDRDSGTVSRITLEADDLPPTFPISAGSTVLDYDLAKVGERDYILPLRSEMQLRTGRMVSKNEVEFRLYRKFSAEATITFDVPDALPPESTTEQPPKP
jgi:hypothetical protein